MNINIFIKKYKILFKFKMSSFAGFYKFRTYNQNEIQKIKKIFKYLKFYQHQSDLDKTIYMRRRVKDSPIPNAIKCCIQIH